MPLFNNNNSILKETKTKKAQCYQHSVNVIDFFQPHSLINN